MFTSRFARPHPLFKSNLLSCLLICGALHIVASSLTGAVREDGQSTPENFLQQYRRIVGDLDVTYRDVVVEGVSGTSRLTQFTYASSGENEKLRIRREEPKYFDRVFVSSGNHRFIVRRPTSEGPYFVENLVNTDEDWEIMKEHRIWVRGAAYHLAGVPNYPKLVNSSNFAIKQITQVSEAGSSLLNIEFEYANSRDAKEPKLEGWFRLDPGLGWVIRSYNYKRRYSILKGKKAGQESVSRVEGWTTYKSEKGKPVPAEIQMKVTAPNGNLRREEHFTISKFLLESAPPGDFSLAAFGLGDLERTAGQNETRKSYWTAAIALAAFLMSLLLFGVGRAIRKQRADQKAILPSTDQSPEGVTRGQDT